MLPYLGLALLTVLLYGRVLRFPFFWDEYFLVRPIGQWSFGGMSPDGRYWRPLWTLWLSVQYHLFGFNPGPMHALSLAFHAVNCWLVLFFLRALGVERRIAIGTAALWTTLGGNATPIVWIPDCGNLIALMLILVATYLWVTVPKGVSPSLARSALASALWLVAMFSKEVAFAWPVAASMYALWRSRVASKEGKHRVGLALLPPVFAFAGYFALRLAFMGRAAGFSVPTFGPHNLRALPPAAIIVARGAHYAEALLYNILPLDLFQTWFGLVAGAAITVALTGALILAARRMSPSNRSPLVWGVVWVAVFSLAGSFNPLPRNLYVATLGTSFILCTVSFSSELFRQRLLPILLLSAYVSMHGYLGQETADYQATESLSTRIHGAQLLLGHDPYMTPSTITPEKERRLRLQLRFDNVQVLSQQKEEETIWRSLLRRAFHRVFGRPPPSN